MMLCSLHNASTAALILEATDRRITGLPLTFCRACRHLCMSICSRQDALLFRRSRDSNGAAAAMMAAADRRSNIGCLTWDEGYLRYELLFRIR